MRKSIAALLFAAFAALAVPATHLMADIIPPIGLAPGSQYQLIFLTKDTHDATSSDISVYNSFVTAEAAQNPLLPSGVTWTAVASTPTINANVNAPSNGLPVYNTAGIEVAPAGLYTSDIPVLSINSFDQFGGPGTTNNEFVWTGSEYDGTGSVNLTLGNDPSNPGAQAKSGGPTFGDHVVKPDLVAPGNRIFTSSTDEPISNFNALYALSSPITVPTPEPATLTLLTSALLLIGGHRLLRRRRELGSTSSQ